MDTTPFALTLGVLGILGLSTLFVLTLLTLRGYQRTIGGNFRRAVRNLRLKRLAAITCLFCLAMAASYTVIQSPWALVYLLIAFKTGTWWFRLMIMQRA